MTTSSLQKCLRSSAFLAIAACLFFFATGHARGREHAPPDVDGVPTVLTCELDGFRYEYHVPTGTESLYASDESRLVNVIEEHRATADACRRALEERCGVARLEVLRGRYGDTIRRLHSLGYL